MDITTTDLGRGPAFLLLHGGGGPLTVAGFAGLLARHGRVVTPTHPGFGGTDRPPDLASPADLARRYVQLLDELELTDVYVVGNSLGGWVAAELALLGSRRVAAVVLVDAVGIEVTGHPIPDFFSLSPAEVAERSWFDPSTMIDPATLPPAVQATLPGNRAALAVYGGTMTDPTLRSRLSAITVPTLVVWGVADRIADVDYGRAFAAAIPGARFVLLSNAGHLPQIETPDALLTAVREFAENSVGRAARLDRVWQIEYTADTDLASEMVWAALCDLETGAVALGSGDRRRLNGAFEVQGTISVTPVGLEPLESTIVEIVEPRVLAEQTHFDGLVLLLRHTLSATGDGRTRITRRLEISGPGADQRGRVVGPRISEDYPEALDEIIATARARI